MRNFEGYRISDTGIVKSRMNNRHGIGDEYHILKPVVDKHGYETVCLGRGNRRLVHRLVAEAFIPNPNRLPLVRHMDDNPRNNCVENLAWGTQVDNMQDCVKHGRLVGDTRAAVESTKKKVIASTIYGEHVGIYDSQKSAATDLGVWPQHVSKVVKGELSQTGGYVFKSLEERGEVNGGY